MAKTKTDTKNTLAEETASFMRRLYERGLTTASGGNISARLDDSSIMITPGSTDKALMTAREIGRIALDGKILDKNFKPTCEAAMHLAVYRARPDVSAIVHAHPAISSAFAAANVQISNMLLAESYVVLGEIGRVPYRNFGTSDLAVSASEAAASGFDAMLFMNHGAMTLGRTLLQAFDRMEVLENAARTTLICEFMLKKSSPIPADGLAALALLRQH